VKREREICPRLGYNTNVFNLSWGLARCKIWFENEVFESPLETCRNINSRKGTRQSLEKQQKTLKGTI
jgi:hypothetical protein